MMHVNIATTLSLTTMKNVKMPFTNIKVAQCLAGGYD